MLLYPQNSILNIVIITSVTEKLLSDTQISREGGNNFYG